MTDTQRIGLRSRRAAGWFRGLSVGAAILGAVAACSTKDILNVEDPDVARPEALSDSTALPAILAGALGNLGVAYNGSSTDINMISLSGMISDEFINTETFPTRIEVDQRRQQYQNNGSLSGLFYAIQQARAAADFAADGYRKFAPSNAGLADALNMSALSLILMAEDYCGAVPLSRETSPGVFEYGPALTTRELLTRAIEKADSALGIAGANSTQARAARVLKARALLNLDDPANAAAAIGGTAGVPSNFQWTYIHSDLTGRQNNGTWALVQNSGRYGVAQAEGTNGLTYRADGDVAGAVKDPRVVNQRRPNNNGNGFDNATAMWWQLKYPARSTPAVLADGVEARLIEAEAQYRANNYAGALVTMQALATDASVATARGYTTAVPVPTAQALPAAQENQLFHERAYWLYLTSHRLGDLRRLSRPAGAAAPEISGYGRGIETVFPTGTYHKSGLYGNDANSPIPQAEDNNPNFNRSSCNIAKP